MYSKEKNRLSKLISNILKEDAEFRLKRDVVKTTLRLICTQDTHVPDLLTRVRVLPSVAVVGQRERVVRPEKGRATLIIYVKYLPTVSETLYESLVSLARKVKSLPGIEVVTVQSVDGRPVMHKGEKIVV